MTQTILVIEDQEQNQYLMKYLLEASGYRVVLAPNGSEGIAAASREQPSMVLLDIHLPGVSGYEVARTICADLPLTDTPIVAVTSYAMPGDREQVMAAGCTGYIEKPINPDTFVSQIQRFMPPGPDLAEESTKRRSQ